jgi:hypothetical protein
LDLSTLEPGDALFSERIVITSEVAAAFRAAVGNDAELYANERLVPTMAVAALVMSAAMRAVELPAGAVHTGQELEFKLPVAENAELACTASVAQNSVRRGSRFLVFEIRGDDGPQTALAGRTTIVVPEPEGEGQ